MFIYNYTEGGLRRNLSSAESILKHTDSCITPSDTGCIVDVVTETFQQIVLDPTKVSYDMFECFDNTAMT